MKFSRPVLIVLSLVVVAIIGFAAYNFSNVSPAQGQYDDFAKCLTEKGVVMYGAYWCPHCANQKNTFGSSFEYINYVECDPNGSNSNVTLCTEKGITGFPTWVFPDGRRYEGETNIKSLSQLSGCQLGASQ